MASAAHLVDPSVDPAAAFPTAAMVAYWRGLDAALEKPFIGRNIGGGSDRLAMTLAGSWGKEIGDAMAAGTGEAEATSMAARSMWYDEKWMQALEEGCKQFVILAAGLDARAWRMPRHGASVKVFELDVPACFAHKHEKLASAPAELVELSCQRIPVEVDLSNPVWTEHLVAAGFDSSAPAFFLAEGLLMYLPPAAVPLFLERVSSVACPGSTFAGCCFINCLDGMMAWNEKLAKFGTKLIFEAKSEKDLRAMLSAANFELVKVADILETMSKLLAEKMPGGTSTPEVDEARSGGKAEQQAKKLLQLCSSLCQWPQGSREQVREMIERDGYRSFAESLVQDEYDMQGLKNESAEYKAQLLEILMESGLEGVLAESLEKCEAVDAETRAADILEVDEAKADQQATKIMQVVGMLKSWPKTAVEASWKHVQASGYGAFAKSIVSDPMNFQGMRDEPQGQKDRVVELVMERGFEAKAKAQFEEFFAVSAEERGASGYVLFLSRKL